MASGANGGVSFKYQRVGGPLRVFSAIYPFGVVAGKKAVNIVNRRSLNIQDPGCRDPAKKASK